MRQQILIIDDNLDILEFLSEELGETYGTHQAENAEIAKMILDNEVIDLVISDIMMPGIDGFELCKFIKSNIAYCHIPVLLLTSKNTYSAHIEGLEVGADAYIQKPFPLEFMQLQVANLLKNRIKIKKHFANTPFEDVRVMASSKTDQAFLKKLDDYIKKNIRHTHLDIDQLAEHMLMSRPTFYRKIKSLSALSPKELIDITRIKRAMELISQNEYTLHQISKMVGFSSQSLFNKNFQRYVKMTPLAYISSLPKSI